MNFKINENTTLFIDRDGVINDESKRHYVKSIDEFEFLPNVKEAFAIFAQQFNRILIVTNQRVVGRQIISENDLNAIHDYMRTELETVGGRVDDIFYCTAVEEQADCRKPNVGMALQAKEKFKEIDFVNSIMIGNTMSDMEFGKKMNMFTCFIASTKPKPDLPNAAIDLYFNNLLDVAKQLQKQ